VTATTNEETCRWCAGSPTARMGTPTTRSFVGYWASCATVPTGQASLRKRVKLPPRGESVRVRTIGESEGRGTSEFDKNWAQIKGCNIKYLASHKVSYVKYDWRRFWRRRRRSVASVANPSAWRSSTRCTKDTPLQSSGTEGAPRGLPCRPEFSPLPTF